MSEASGVEAVVGRARVAFGRSFGGDPTFGASAPGRVNLIGEHTDYNDGFVLPIAIDRSCVCVGAPAADGGRSRVVSADAEGTASFDIRRGVAPGEVAGGDLGGGVGWSRYIAGVMEHFRRKRRKGDAGFIMPNLDLAVASSVPLGSGLSSSASLEVAVATALASAMGVRTPGIETALLCQRAEHEFAGVPCGIMDQFASVFGVAGSALLIDCRDLSFRPAPLPLETADDGAMVIVANTNVRHSLAESEYAARRSACRSAAAKLGVTSLRDLDVDGWDSEALNDEESRCVRHVTGEVRRVLDTAAALESGRETGDWRSALQRVGRLMYKSHASLRDDYRVSCPELDTLVELARSGAGVYGARMTGAGFGGCIVALVEPAGARALIACLEREYPRRHGRACSVFITRAADGARALDMG